MTLTLSGEGCRTRGDNWVAIWSITTAPETFPGYHDFPYNVTQATWSSPLTSRLLLEAGFSRFHYLWAGFGIAPPDSFNTLIPVTEQSTMYGQGNYSYRGLYDPLGVAYADNDANPNNWRASASYVTGAHNIKVGYQGSYQRSLQARVANQTQLQYRFNNGVPNGLPTSLSRRARSRTTGPEPGHSSPRTSGPRRLTLHDGFRYDRAWARSAEHNGRRCRHPLHATPIRSPGQSASPAGTTSTRGSAPPTTCSATAGPRSR